MPPALYEDKTKRNNLPPIRVCPQCRRFYSGKTKYCSICSFERWLNIQEVIYGSNLRPIRGVDDALQKAKRREKVREARMEAKAKNLAEKEEKAKATRAIWWL